MPANMASSFHALGNDDVASRIYRSPRLFLRANLPAGQGSLGMHYLDELGLGFVVEELDEPR